MEKRLQEIPSKRLRSHIVHIENRELISISGVKAVDSFNEYEITLITDVGELHVEGNNLNITKLNLDDGQVMIDGEISALDYEEDTPRKRSIFGIFK